MALLPRCHCKSLLATHSVLQVWAAIVNANGLRDRCMVLTNPRLMVSFILMGVYIDVLANESAGGILFRFVLNMGALH